jgi:hypothetical protein
MVTRLPTRFHAAGFLVLKVINKLGDCGFFNAKAFQTGMLPW